MKSLSKRKRKKEPSPAGSPSMRREGEKNVWHLVNGRIAAIWAGKEKGEKMDNLPMKKREKREEGVIYKREGARKERAGLSQEKGGGLVQVAFSYSVSHAIGKLR